jgi:hypothetical protein
MFPPRVAAGRHGDQADEKWGTRRAPNSNSFPGLKSVVYSTLARN